MFVGLFCVCVCVHVCVCMYVFYHLFVFGGCFCLFVCVLFVSFGVFFYLLRKEVQSWQNVFRPKQEFVQMYTCITGPTHYSLE